MKIIYHCFGGSHSSVTAAAIHLGMLSESRLPTIEELKKLPYFDRQVKKDHGTFRLMGKDVYDNEIYIVGRRNMYRVLENMIKGLSEIYGYSPKEIIPVNVMPYVNWYMMVGGYISRKLGFIKLGRPIVSRGTVDSYLKLVSLVQKIKVLAASNLKS